MLKKF